MNEKANELDPLYVIFEHHLYTFDDSELDRNAFIQKVVQDYFAQLRRMKISIPKSIEPSMAEELGEQVYRMLVKKIYGCLNIAEFHKNAETKSTRKVRSPRAKTLAQTLAKKRYTRLFGKQE